MSEKTRRAGIWAAALLAATSARAGTSAPYCEPGAEIMARQGSADRIQGPRPAPPRFAVRRRAASSHPGAGSPSLASGGVAAPAPAAAQSLGVSFLGADLADSSSFPPDTSGAAGPTQFLVAVCGAGAYCPATANTRGQMAVLLAKTFSLP
jgi:hypothetical protein